LFLGDGHRVGSSFQVSRADGSLRRSVAWVLGAGGWGTRYMFEGVG
jgi:hypothetical protein